MRSIIHRASSVSWAAEGTCLSHLLQGVPANRGVAEVVVAEKGDLKRAKLFYAAVAGCPVVKRAWVEACVAAGKPLPMDGSLVWKAAQPPLRMFSGLRIVLHCPGSSAQHAEQLLRHAGESLQAASCQQCWMPWLSKPMCIAA